MNFGSEHSSPIEDIEFQLGMHAEDPAIERQGFMDLESSAQAAMQEYMSGTD